MSVPYHGWTHRPKAQGGTDPVDFLGFTDWLSALSNASSITNMSGDITEFVPLDFAEASSNTAFVWDATNGGIGFVGNATILYMIQLFAIDTEAPPACSIGLRRYTLASPATPIANSIGVGHASNDPGYTPAGLWSNPIEVGHFSGNDVSTFWFRPYVTMDSWTPAGTPSFGISLAVVRIPIPVRSGSFTIS